MAGPEANFWQSLKRAKPPECHAIRLENRAGGGVPDVHMVWDGLPFWIELKTTNSNTVKVSPHQIAWHTAYSARGGLSFFLVKSQSSLKIKLLPGSAVRDLVSLGLESAPGLVFSRANVLYPALRAEVVEHYTKVMQNH